MQHNIPNRFYRVSVKALILDEERNKFLICQESDNHWELPGGGLDWGEDPQTGLAREIEEEMGLKTTRIAANPSYFLTGRSTNYPEIRIANILFETELEHLDFTPSSECQAIQFVDKNDLSGLQMYDGVVQLAEMFDPNNHY